MKKKNSFWGGLWQFLKILIICLVGFMCVITFSKCSSSLTDFNFDWLNFEKIEVPEWFPDRPSWVPDWVPSIFEKETSTAPENSGNNNGDNTGDNTGDESSDDNQHPTSTSVVTITFNANGGTLTSSNTMQTSENGTLVEFPSDPTYEGYMFGGWTITQYPVGEFSEGDGVSLRHVFYEDTEVYALWLETPDLPEGEGEGENGENTGGGESEGDEGEGENGESTGGGESGGSTIVTESWGEYQSIEDPDEQYLPLEYCLGNDEYGNNGIKIRPTAELEEYLAGNSGILEIPIGIDGAPVLKIERGAFTGRTDIVELYVRGPVAIEKFAFSGCTNLTSVVLVDGCRIFPQTFKECTSLSEINLANFAYVGDAVFYRSGIGTDRSATFDFSASLSLNEFLGKYLENEWEHMLGKEYGAFYDLGKTEPVFFIFSDCEILYYSENEDEETLLKHLETI